MLQNMKRVGFFIGIIIFSAQICYSDSSTTTVATNYATSLKTILQFVDTFDPMPTDETQPIILAIKLFSVDKNKDAALSSLTIDDTNALIKAVSLLRYGTFYGLANVSKDSTGSIIGTSSDKAQSYFNIVGYLENILSSLQVGAQFPDTFEGRKKRIIVSLDTYKNMPKAKIAQLVSQKQILSISDLIGSGSDGAGGWLARLVAERMQSSDSDLKDSNGVAVVGDSALEDPNYSWQSIRDILDKAKLVLTPYSDNSQTLTSVCNNLITKLMMPIPFAERVSGLQARMNDESLLQNDFVNAVSRAAKSLSSTVDVSARKTMFDLINSYVVKNSIDRNANSWISRFLNQFSGSVLSFEVFKDQEIIAFRMSDLTTNVQTFLSRAQGSIVDSVTNYDVTTSKNGLVDALFFKIYLIQDYIFFETQLGNKYFYLCNSIDSTGLGTKINLRSTTSAQDSSKSLSDVFKANLNLTQIDALMRHFGSADFTNYAFKFYTSETDPQRTRNAVSLKNEAVGGYVTLCLDGFFRTRSPGDNQPFLLPAKGSGGFEQPTRSTFIAVSQTNAVMALAKNHRENFVISDDGVVTVRNPRAVIDGFSQALSLEIGNDVTMKSLLGNEINLLFQGAANSQAGFSALQDPATSKLMDQILMAYAQASAQLFIDQPEILSIFNQVQQKWAYLKNASFIPPLDPNLAKVLPSDGQTVALQISGGTNTLFLQLVPRKKVDGSITFELLSTATTPLDPTAQFTIIEVKSLFGFKSLFANSNYLTVKSSDEKEIGSTLQDVSDFKVDVLATTTIDSTNNLVLLPFEANSNQNKQFVFESVNSNANNQIFYLKNSLTNQYLSIKSGSSAIVFGSRNEALTIQPFILSVFLQNLSMASIEPDELKKIKKYIDLLDNALTVDDVRFLLNDVNNFLTQKRTTFDLWNKFISDSNKLQSLKLFESKLDSLFQNKATSLNGLLDLKSKTKSLIEDEYSDKMSNLVQNGALFAIKWIDGQGKSYYLKFKDDKKTIGFYGSTISDPNVVLQFVVSNDGFIKIGFKNLIDNKIEDTYLTVNDQNFSLSPENTGAEFSFAGQFSGMNIKLISRDPSDSNKVTELPGYLGVRNLVTPLSIFSGVNTDVGERPVLGQQIFVVEKLSAFDLMLVDAQKACNLQDSIWSASVARNWSNNDDLTLSKALADRIGKYTAAFAFATTNPLGLDDKQEIVYEIESFVSDLTSLLGGHAYTLILKDDQIRSLFETNVLGGLAKLIAKDNNQDLINAVAKIEQSWKDGYVGASALKKGEIVSIGFSDGFLSVTQQTLNGKKVWMLQKSKTFLDKNSLFTISTYKDKIAFMPISLPNNFISAELVTGQNSKIGWYSRVVLTTANQKNSKGEIDLANDSNMKFAFNYDNGAISFNYKDGSGDLQTSRLVVDNNDGGFVKGLVNVINPTNLIDTFTIQERGPFHVRLTDAISSIDVGSGLAIFSELLKENYLNSLEDGNNFIQAIVNFFENQKANDANWTKFLADQKQRDAVKAFFVLVDQVTSSILPDDKKAIAKAAVSGDVSADVTKFSGQYVTLTWKDFDGNLYVLQQNTIQNLDGTTSEDLSWTGSDLLSVNSQFKVFVNNGGAELAVDSSDTLKFLFIDQSGNLSLQSTETDSIVFKIFGTSGKTYLRQDVRLTTAEGVSDISSLFLSIDTTTTARSAKMLSGIEVGSDLRPTVFQEFYLDLVSDFNRSLAKAKALTDDAAIISSFSSLATQLSSQKDNAKLAILITEVNKFVQSRTSDKTKFTSLSTNLAAVTSLKNLFAQLSNLVKTMPELTPQVNLIKTSWNEGFMGSPDSLAPQDGSIVLLKDIISGNFLEVVSVAFQGNNYLQLSLTSTNQVAKTSQFKVKVYKDKFGFESVAYPGMFWKVPQTSSGNQNLSLATNRVMLASLADDTASGAKLFGAVDTENLQFMLTSTSSTSPATFNIKSRLQNSNLIIDSNDQSFVRTLLDATSNVSNLSNFMILPVTPLHNKLMQIASLQSDQDILLAYAQIISQSFVLNNDSVDVFRSSFLSYLEQKTSTLSTWQAFTNDQNLAKTFKQLLTTMSTNSLFKNLVTEIQSIVSKGYVQNFNDQDYVVLRWMPSQDNVSILNAALDGSNLFLKTDSSVTNTGMITSNAVFRVNLLTYKGRDVVQLVFEGEDGDRFLQILDKKTGTTLQRSPAVFNLISSNDLKNDSILQSTLFALQGDFAQLSFKSILTNGFLSRGSDDSFASVTMDSQAKLAGVWVGSLLNPGQMEQFTVQVLSKTSKALVDVSNPTNPADIAPFITTFTNYPTFYQQETSDLLKNNLNEKAHFFDALEQFVGRISVSQSLSRGITPENDKSFLALIQVLKGLNLSKNESARVDKLLLNWIVGYPESTKLSGPSNGTSFIWMVAPQSTTVKGSTTQNELFATNMRVVNAVPQANKDQKPILCTVNFDDKLKQYVTADADTLAEKFLLFNDPFASQAIFLMNERRNKVAISLSSDPTVYLNFDNTINLANNDFDLGNWKKAVGIFQSIDLSSLPQNSTAFFVVSSISDTDKFSFQHILGDGYISFDLKDGCGRIFRTTLNNSKVAVESVKSPDNPFEQFILLGFTDFHKQILLARSAKDYLTMIAEYQKAIDLIATQYDLTLCAQELCRYVISKKTSKDVWNSFVGNKDLVDKVSGLLQKIIDKFVNQKIGNLVLADADKSMLGKQLLYLAGKLTPRFVQASIVEAQVLYIVDSYNNLRAQLDGLDDSTVDVFVENLEDLFRRRVELDLNNSLTGDLVNFVQSQSVIADWVEFEVSQNSVIQKNSNNAKKVAGLIQQFRSDFKYSEIIDNLSAMLDKISGFSEDRAALFLLQVSKAVDPANLTKALNDFYPLENLRNVLRRAMANQLKPFLEKSYLGGSTKGSTATTNKQYLLNLISSLAYPVQKGDAFNNLVNNWVAKINSQTKTNVDLGSIQALADLVANWDASINSGLVYNDIANSAFKNNSKQADALKTAKKFYLSNLNTKLNTLIAKLQSLGVDSSILQNFSAIQSALPVVQNSTTATNSAVTTTLINTTTVSTTNQQTTTSVVASSVSQPPSLSNGFSVSDEGITNQAAQPQLTTSVSQPTAANQSSPAAVVGIS